MLSLEWDWLSDAASGRLRVTAYRATVPASEGNRLAYNSPSL